MENIASTTDLKDAIQLLELEQRAKGQQLKEQLYETYSTINPVNLLKDSIKGFVSPPNIVDNLIVGGLSLVTGYLTKRVIIGSSTNIFRKLLGSAIQFGTSSVVSQNAAPIKTVGEILYKLISRKKKKNKHL